MQLQPRWPIHVARPQPAGLLHTSLAAAAPLEQAQSRCLSGSEAKRDTPERVGARMRMSSLLWQRGARGGPGCRRAHGRMVLWQPRVERRAHAGKHAAACARGGARGGAALAAALCLAACAAPAAALPAGAAAACGRRGALPRASAAAVFLGGTGSACSAGGAARCTRAPDAMPDGAAVVRPARAAALGAWSAAALLADAAVV